MACSVRVAVAFLVLAAPSRGTAVQAPRGAAATRIGVVLDGPSEFTDSLRSQFAREIVAFFSTERTVEFPASATLRGDWTVAGATAAIDRLLADPGVDIVLALGPMGSNELAHRKTLPKPEQRGPNDPLAANPLNDRRIRTALDSQLVAHGYTRDSTGTSDFLVAYHAATRARTSLDAWGYGPGRWRGGRVDVNQFTEGTLIVDMVDPASKQLVWRGTAAGTIQLKDVDKKIREAAKKLTERFVKDGRSKGDR